MPEFCHFLRNTEISLEWEVVGFVFEPAFMFWRNDKGRPGSKTLVSNCAAAILSLCSVGGKPCEQLPLSLMNTVSHGQSCRLEALQGTSIVSHNAVSYGESFLPNIDS